MVPTYFLYHKTWKFLKYLDKCSKEDGTYKCQNGGTCIITDGGQAVCKCFDQYIGIMCEYGTKSRMTYFCRVFKL